METPQLPFDIISKILNIRMNEKRKDRINKKRYHLCGCEIESELTDLTEEDYCVYCSKELCSDSSDEESD